MGKTNKSVLFLPGMFAGGWVWERSTPHINNITPITLDEPLCNLSDSIDGLCDILEPIAKNASGGLTLVGNSLGSLLALKLAARLKDKVDGVVISGTPGFGKFNVNLKLRRDNPKAMKQNLIEVICHDTSAASHYHFDKIVKSFAEKFRAIIRLANEANKTDILPVLSAVDCPIYAIWGANDIMTPLGSIQPVLDAHKITTHIIDRCGHSPMYERPLEFASEFEKCL